MEFGILGAEPSGSFREEEVVGMRVRKRLTGAGVAGLKGLWLSCSPLFCSCPGTPGFGKAKAPEVRVRWPVPGDSASHRLRGLAPESLFCFFALLTQHLLGSQGLVVIPVVSAVRPMVREDVFGEFLLLGSVVILEEDFP